MQSTYDLRLLAGILIILLFIFLGSCDQESTELPEGFELKEGFSMELVASEPLVKDPVDLEFDERGDAYVLEMPGYPFEDTQSRVLLLQDTNNDGIYDSDIVYADNLELASSIMPYKKGILVAAPPYLLFLKDTNGDDVADLRDTIMTGFSTGNLQHNYNGLTFGIDNWIYAANGGNSGKIYWHGDTSAVMDLREDDIRIDIENRIIERVGQSSGGYELAIDEYGRVFGTHNLEHVSQIIYPSRYAKGYRLSPSHALSNISDHEDNGLARIYPIGEQESRVNHPEQSGYFSGACGITYYGGGAFGERYNQSIWIADVVLNLIHVDKLSEGGSGMNASRIIQDKDILASSDRSFRPVNMTVGPDGSLYVIDMYREVIEHPEWIPDDIEKTLDLESGKDKGRIYKITKNGEHSKYNYDNFKSIEGLLSSLEHSNQWVRNTAHRLLLDNRLSKEDINKIKIAVNSESAYGRLHSMWILHTMNSLSPTSLIQFLQDNESGTIENALIISESYINKDDSIIQSCIKLLADSNQRVRMQAALTLSTIDQSKSKQFESDLLNALVASSQLEMDRWNAQAISLAGKTMPSKIFKAVINEHEPSNKQEILTSLALIGTHDPSEVVNILSLLSSASLPAELKYSIVNAITKHLSTNQNYKNILTPIRQIESVGDINLLAATADLRKKLGLPSSPQFLSKSKEALAQVIDRSKSEELRLKQMSLLRLIPYRAKSNLLFELLSNKESLQLQEHALLQLSEASDSEIGHRLVAKWKDLGPQSRRTAGDILLYNEIHHDALLSGLEDGTINIGEMNFDLERRRTLLWWTDNQETKRRAEALFSDAGVVNRKDAIHKMKPALTLGGSPKNGSEVFTQNCAQCHTYGDAGSNVGPVLTEISRKSKESLLHDILDPNAAVDTKYINHRLETNDGAVHVGIVDHESDTDIRIKKMGGTSITIAKENIKRFTSLGTSMMLEGLESNMTLQDMADLLAYLQHGVD